MEKHGVTIFEDWVWSGENHGIWILKNLADFVPALNNKQWLVQLSLQVIEKTATGDGGEIIYFKAREYNGNYKDKNRINAKFTESEKADYWITTDDDAMIEIYFDFDINEERKRKAKVILELSLD